MQNKAQKSGKRRGEGWKKGKKVKGREKGSWGVEVLQKALVGCPGMQPQLLPVSPAHSPSPHCAAPALFPSPAATRAGTSSASQPKASTQPVLSHHFAGPRNQPTSPFLPHKSAILRWNPAGSNVLPAATGAQQPCNVASPGGKHRLDVIAHQPERRGGWLCVGGDCMAGTAMLLSKEGESVARSLHWVIRGR